MLEVYVWTVDWRGEARRVPNRTVGGPSAWQVTVWWDCLESHNLIGGTVSLCPCDL